VAPTGAYRLDVTVAALRRLPSNLVDLLTDDGSYARALDGHFGLVVASVDQLSPERLSVTLDGDPRDHDWALGVVRRTLGVACDLSPFDRAARRIAWLRRLADRMRGVKPPRYPTLWEACVNAVIFQQISLAAASSIMGRLVADLGRRIESAGNTLHVFPTVESVLGAGDERLRRAGLSASKVATLRHIGESLMSGTLSEGMLEERTSAEAAAVLTGVRGVGPWTAAVILLRGLGRLDVFPARDTGVARNLALLAGSTPIDMAAALEVLRPQQGMLYFHLLLARLEARGELARPSAIALERY
jgi:DNA-3-methyladenine glycosylase II